MNRPTGLVPQKHPRASGVGEAIHEFLVFVLSGELYAVPLARVREIVLPPPITVLPRAPGHVVGVCSIRGLLVTVIDLRKRLSLAVSAPTTKSRILLTESSSGEVVGLLADDVQQVVRLAAQQIESVAQVFGGDPPSHVMGIGRTGEHSIVLLNLASVVGS